MRTLNTSGITGFYTPTGVVIFDGQGKFIDYKKAVNFNLPPGEYYIMEGSAAASGAPVKYDRLPLLPRQKFNPDPGDLKFHYSKQTYKAKTNAYTGDVYVHPEWIETLTTPQLTFAIQHEQAHKYYFGNTAEDPWDLQGEIACDIMAADWMLQHGFNPLQTANAALFTLDQDAKTSWLRTEILTQILKLKSHG